MGMKFVITLLAGLLMFNCLAKANTVTGFDIKGPVDADNNGKYTCLNKKLVKSYWEYPDTGHDSVAWQSAVVPKKLAKQPVTLRFACGLGAHNGFASHQLYLNGKKLLAFNVQYGDFTVKTTAATFKFSPVYLDGNDDLFGVAELTVMPELINFGHAQKLKIVGDKKKSKAWFMLFAIAAPAPQEITRQREKNSIKRRIEIIKVIKAKSRIKAKQEAAQPHIICRWPHNSNAAVSQINATEQNNDYEGAQQLTVHYPQSPAKFEAAVDQAIIDRAWLVVKYAKQYFTTTAMAGMKQNLDYLQQLDCVVWTAPPDKVVEYIRMRHLAKLIVEQKKAGHARVTMHGFPSGFKANLPLTVQVTLPKNAWGIKVRNQRQGEKVHHLIVTAKKRGVRFEMTPGNGPVDIYYND